MGPVPGRLSWLETEPEPVVATGCCCWRREPQPDEPHVCKLCGATCVGVKALEAQRAEVRECVADFKEEVRIRDEKVASLSAELAALKEQHAKEVSAHEATRRKAAEDADMNAKAIAAAEADARAAREEARVAQDEGAVLKDKADMLMKEAERLHLEREDEAMGYEAEVHRLRDEIKASHAELEMHRADLKGNGKEPSRFVSRAEFSAVETALNDARARLDAEAKDHGTALRDLAAERAARQAEVDARDRAADKLRADLAAMPATIDRLTKEGDALRTELDGLRTEHTEVLEVAHQHGRCPAALDAERATIAALREEIEGLRREVEKDEQALRDAEDARVVREREFQELVARDQERLAREEEWRVQEAAERTRNEELLMLGEQERQRELTDEAERRQRAQLELDAVRREQADIEQQRLHRLAVWDAKERAASLQPDLGLLVQEGRGRFLRTYEVREGGPCHDAGIREGDGIVAVNGIRIPTLIMFAESVRLQCLPGLTVPFTMARGTDRFEANVEVGAVGMDRDELRALLELAAEEDSDIGRAHGSPHTPTQRPLTVLVGSVSDTGSDLQYRSRRGARSRRS